MSIINRLAVNERQRIANADLAELMAWWSVPQETTLTFPGGSQISFKLSKAKEAWATRHADGSVTLRLTFEPFHTFDSLDGFYDAGENEIAIEVELGHQRIPPPVEA